MRGHRWIMTVLAGLLCVGIAPAQATDTTAQDTTNTTALVRLSFVQGQVRVLQGGQTLFDQAQVNMPLSEGYAIATAEDGQAEVEFTDGSVARVAPNSELRLDRLPQGQGDGASDMSLLSGLGYFELNAAYGQSFAVHFGDAAARPVSNATFRVDLDNMPDVAVLSGTVRAIADGGLDRTIEAGNTLSFNPGDPADATEAASIEPNSWDQWNQDRDNQIAQEAQQQSAASETEQTANQPGWDDLDQYGDWYPVNGYGNVWVPSDQPTGWDPYGYGSWANYPGFGYMWVSGYPWGWLPYRCGAWSYWNTFGWGWIPSQCGLGWRPIVTFRNVPPGYRPPMQPRPIPGGHIGPPIQVGRIIPVHSGPVLPHGGVRYQHTRPIQVNGQRIDPLPIVNKSPLPMGGRIYGNGPAHPAPTGNSTGGTGDVRRGMPPVQAQPARPVFQPAPGNARPAPPPRASMPPRVYSPPPPPRMSAPPPRMSAPPAPSHH